VNLATASTGCGTSALRDDKLVYQISMETTLNEFDINMMNNVGPISGHTTNYYELAQEPVSGNLYASETDFFSFGKVHLFDSQNNEISNFNVGVSPGTVVFDVRSSAGVSEINESISIYPNPTVDELHVIKGGVKRVFDLTGKLMLQSNENILNVSDLNQGMYVLEVNGAKAHFIKK
jgi:hypothetical protein